MGGWGWVGESGSGRWLHRVCRWELGDALPGASSASRLPARLDSYRTHPLVPPFPPPSFNEPPEAPLVDPTRRGFEQLLRKLARLPRAPAVIVLHHYAWYFAAADGLQAGLFYHRPEQHLSTLAQVRADAASTRAVARVSSGNLPFIPHPARCALSDPSLHLSHPSPS